MRGHVAGRRCRAARAVGLLAVALSLVSAQGAYAQEAPGEPSTATVTPRVVTEVPLPRAIVVGRSVAGRKITLLRFGQGSRRVLIVGGIHGNEAGTAVAKAFAGYLRANPSVIPSGTELDILAAANPDGVAARTRGNANRVDLNRNFPSRDWRRLRYRGLTSGRREGSQPETKALVALLKRDYARVLSLHSKGSFTDGEGRGGVALARAVAKSAGIKRVDMDRFGSYPGSMGSYCPQRYPTTPYVVWELSNTKFTSKVRAGLVTFAR